MLNRFQNYKDLLASPLIWLSLVAGVLYSSWPWGYALRTGMSRVSLASELEAPHHPYNWLFIGMDVTTGLILATIAARQLHKHRQRSQQLAIVGYLIFGVLVAVAALTPLVCDPTTQSCGPILHNSHILIHGLASIMSVIFLLGALVTVTLNSYRRRASRLTLAILGTILLAWVAFGVGSLLQMNWHLHDGQSLQYFFISVCSLSVVAVVVAIEIQAHAAKHLID